MGMVGLVVAIAVSILVVVAIVPTALETYFAVDTGNWSATGIVMWGLVGTFAVLALGLGFLSYIKIKGK